MIRLLLIGISSLAYNIAIAGNCTLTVVAVNGLSIRKEPSIQSERLAVVQFGETVISHGSCDNIDPGLTSDFLEIDRMRGFWIEVQYQKISGYMFSGYLVAGNVFKLAKSDTIDNVLIDEVIKYGVGDVIKYDYFYYEYYTPKLHWYGIKVYDTMTSITPLTIHLDYDNNRWSHNYDGNQIVALKFDDKGGFDFLFGSKKELGADTIHSQYHFGCNSRPGVFLYPEQEYVVDDGWKYPFKAREVIVETDNTNSAERFQRQYMLSLMRGQEEVTFVDKILALNLHFDAHIHTIYQSPQILWSGDLNRDGFTDFAFVVSPMQDKCGAVPNVNFMFSHIDANGNLIYKGHYYPLDLDNFRAY